MHRKKHVIAAAPLLLSLAAFTQEALAVTDISTCRTIGTSGSFRLTKNLSAKGDCLLVTANRVEIDLQGHTIRGDSTGFGVRDVFGQPLQFAITVRNGIIANFAFGVDLRSTQGAVVEQLRVVETGTTGIQLFSGRVRSNVVFDVDALGGISVTEAAVVSDNFVSRVGQIGILVGDGSSVVGNSVSDVGRQGVFVSDCPARVTDNSVTGFDRTKTDGFTAEAIDTFGNGCSISGNASN